MTNNTFPMTHNMMNSVALLNSSISLLFKLNRQETASYTNFCSTFKYLNISLSCTVCKELLIDPYTPPDTRICQHHVCKKCLTRKKTIKPSCWFCDNHKKYVQNSTLQEIVKCFSMLCKYILKSDSHKYLINNSGNINGKVLSELLDILHGACGYIEKLEMYQGNKEAFTEVVRIPHQNNEEREKYKNSRKEFKRIGKCEEIVDISSLMNGISASHNKQKSIERLTDKKEVQNGMVRVSHEITNISRAIQDSMLNGFNGEQKDKWKNDGEKLERVVRNSVNGIVQKQKESKNNKSEKFTKAVDEPLKNGIMRWKREFSNTLEERKLEMVTNRSMLKEQVIIKINKKYKRNGMCRIKGKQADLEENSTDKANQRITRNRIMEVNKMNGENISESKRMMRKRSSTSQKIDSNDSEKKLKIDSNDPQGISKIDSNDSQGESIIDSNASIGNSKINSNESQGNSKIDSNGPQGKSIIDSNESQGISVIDSNDPQGISKIDSNDPQGISIIDSNDSQSKSKIDSNDLLGKRITEVNKMNGENISESKRTMRKRSSTPQKIDSNDSEKKLKIDSNGSQGISVIDSNDPQGISKIDSNDPQEESIIDSNDSLGNSKINSNDTQGNSKIDSNDPQGISIIDSNESQGISIIDSNDPQGKTKIDSNDPQGISIIDSNESQGISIIDSNDPQGKSKIDSNDPQGKSKIDSNGSQGISIIDSNHSQSKSIIDSNESQGISIIDSNESQGILIINSNDPQGISIIDSNHSQSKSKIDSNDPQGKSKIDSNDSQEKSKTTNNVASLNENVQTETMDMIPICEIKIEHNEDDTEEQGPLCKRTRSYTSAAFLNRSGNDDPAFSGFNIDLVKEEEVICVEKMKVLKSICPLISIKTEYSDEDTIFLRGRSVQRNFMTSSWDRNTRQRSWRRSSNGAGTSDEGQLDLTVSSKGCNCGRKLMTAVLPCTRGRCPCFSNNKSCGASCRCWGCRNPYATTYGQENMSDKESIKI